MLVLQLTMMSLRHESLDRCEYKVGKLSFFYCSSVCIRADPILPVQLLLLLDAKAVA